MFRTVPQGDDFGVDSWGNDFPAAPSLIDVTVDGRPIKAIAQVSKQGFTYVFDRVTGEPVWPIEERPVETDTDLVGDVLSPTQPYVGGDGRGGVVVTKTLIVSGLTAGGTDDGPRLVARDKATGAIVGSVDLPGGPIGTPMTYMFEGTQYIALTVGGDVPELVAFALPPQPRDPMRGDVVEEVLREIEPPQVREAVQQPVGVGGIAAWLELPEPDEPRHAGVDRFVE